MGSGRVYILNHSIDPTGDLGDIRLALYYTPLYCVLVTSVYDIDLAKEFSELANIYIVGSKAVLDLAWEYADESEMAVLVLGDAIRLDEVKKEGTREVIAC